MGPLTALMVAGIASASTFQLEARTEARVYQIRAWRDASPGEPVLLPRRRIVQYLGLNGYELVTGQDVGFESSLRVFADFGLPRGEAARIDGLRSEDADLLYAFVRYGGSGFEGRLGRQLYVDVSDILAFDGLRVRYVTVTRRRSATSRAMRSARPVTTSRRRGRERRRLLRRGATRATRVSTPRCAWRRRGWTCHRRTCASATRCMWRGRWSARRATGP